MQTDRPLPEVKGQSVQIYSLNKLMYRWIMKRVEEVVDYFKYDVSIFLEGLRKTLK